ncbi:hypothetical protein U9M48_025283, partial [Paspalum notatum var. saurae]
PAQLFSSAQLPRLSASASSGPRVSRLPPPTVPLRLACDCERATPSRHQQPAPTIPGSSPSTPPSSSIAHHRTPPLPRTQLCDSEPSSHWSADAAARAPGPGTPPVAVAFSPRRRFTVVQADTGIPGNTQESIDPPLGIMGMLSLKRLMSTQQGGRRCRRRRQQVVQDRNEPVNSRSKATEYGERTRDAGPNLPEEIWCHIHSLMPMEDSARAACVSRTFLHSWRHHPYLILNNETLGLKWNACGKDSEKHSVAGVKTLKLDVSDCCDLNDCYLNDWLHIAITPRTESVTLELPSRHKEELYNFPCSLL